LWRKKASGASSGLSLKAALDYYRLGWSVIPVEPRGKHPLIAWKVFQYRRAEVPEIAEWLRHWPDANIAVVTGVISGLVVLDLDPRHGAEASLERLRHEHGALPDTVEATTGGGGRHLYFAHPGEITSNRVGLAPGIDLRGDGGYVVAPPSVHPNGEPYRWLRAPEVLQPAALPPWLLRLPLGTGPTRGHPPSHWRDLIRDGVGEGRRNISVASLAGYLLHHGIDPEVVAELLLGWNQARCRPPLDDAEVLRTVDSIERLHRQGRDGAG
jgi:Bifunctional DNA primase/polymerase, N-terminal/Primase C terminal 1 (PriCT-1)